MILLTRFFFLIICLLPLSVWAQENTALSVGEIRYTHTEERAPFSLPVGSWNGAELPTLAFEGQRRDQVLFYGQSLATPTQILTPLREALIENGYQQRLNCRDIECGGYDFQMALDAISARYRPIALFDYVAQSFVKDEHAVFLLASRSQLGGWLYRIDLTPKGSAAITAPAQVTRPPDTAAIVLDGLVFATGENRVEIENPAYINALVAQLTANPNVRVMLVGHSDNRGGLDANIKLSRARAEQVRQMLITQYGIEAARLDAAGVGFLAPRASNETAEGRLLNRRVEAVFLDD